MSGTYFPLWTVVSSTQICSHYALSSPSFTAGLRDALSGFPMTVMSEFQYATCYSCDSLAQLKSYLNDNYQATRVAWWASLGGAYMEHEFYRSYADRDFTERWGGRYGY